MSIFRRRLMKQAEEEEERRKFVHFEDKEVRDVFVRAFDKDGDGRISYTEAAEVTDEEFSKISLKNTKAKVLIELGYFYNVTKLPQFFCYNSYIEKVVIPKNIKSVGSYNFDNIKLNTLELIIEGSPYILEFTMTVARLVVIKASVSTLRFANIMSFWFNVDPDSQSYSSYDGSVLSKDGKILYKARFLEDKGIYVTPPNVKIIGEHSLRNNASKTIISEGVTSIWGYAIFNNAGIIKMDFPTSLISFNSNSIFGNRNLATIVFRNPTAVDFPKSLFSGCPSISAVYVPDESVEEYKGKLSQLADKILPLSQYVDN